MKIEKQLLGNYELHEMMVVNNWTEKGIQIVGSVWNLYIVKGELKAGKENELKTIEYSKLPKYIKVVIDKFNQDKSTYEKAQATEEIEKELNELAPAVKEVAKNSFEVTYKNLDNKKEVTIEITENGFAFGGIEVGFDEVGINAVVSYILTTVTTLLDKSFNIDRDESKRKQVFKSVVSDTENNRIYNGECVETKDGYEIEIEFEEFEESNYCYIQFDEVGNVTKILFSGKHIPKAIRGEFIGSLRSMLSRKVVS